MKPIIFYLIIQLLLSPSVLTAQPDFNGEKVIEMNIEVDSLAAVYWPDNNRVKIIELEKGNDRSAIVKFFSQLNANQKADVMKNRMHQALTVTSLSMLQKRVIVWVMKQVKPEIYDEENPKREEEVKKITTEIIPLLSKHFSKEQVCLLFAECSMKGIE